uniref:Uncharacterized protein n=1 Tax=Physcomitrium patens TaxID=3218 RepID=A0A2K1L0M3_PHYPA|nr:hypothetical protein PHYPA_002370 [Physcomitrium patens]
MACDGNLFVIQPRRLNAGHLKQSNAVHEAKRNDRKVVHKSNCTLVVGEEARGLALLVMQICKEHAVPYDILCSGSCCHIFGFGSANRNTILLSNIPVDGCLV